MTRTINLVFTSLIIAAMFLGSGGCKAPEKEKHDPNATLMVEMDETMKKDEAPPTADERKRAGVLEQDLDPEKTWGTSGTITWRSRISQAWTAAERNDLNVLVFFYDPQSKECREIDSIFKNSQKLIDLSAYFYCVKLDVNKPANAEEVKYYRGDPAPQIVVYNPGRAQLWRSQDKGQVWSEEELIKRLRLYRRRTEKRKGS